METIHAEGNFTTGTGMNAVVTTPYILYNGNELSNLNFRAYTTDSGLKVNGIVGHVKSGNSFDIYNARINATAQNNNIDFNVGIDDRSGKNKYHLGGLLTQPSSGTYSIKLRPDRLLLNYELWTVNPGNQLIISPENITANNFVLQKDNQVLSLNSIDGNGMPLQVSFKDFRLATITGFIKSDSLLFPSSVYFSIQEKI
jgi:hypothetical protein